LYVLADLPAQNRIEVESVASFTDRYAPVQAISGTTITMQQPAHPAEQPDVVLLDLRVPDRKGQGVVAVRPVARPCRS
jgi:hypothetical protein